MGKTKDRYYNSGTEKNTHSGKRLPFVLTCFLNDTLALFGGKVKGFFLVISEKYGMI